MFGDRGRFRWRKKLLFGLVVLIVLPVLVAGVSRKKQSSDSRKDVAKFQRSQTPVQRKSTSRDRTHMMTYLYNEQGRLVGVDYGDSMVITYSYDDAGNLLSRTIRRGSLSAGDGEVERPFTYGLSQNYPNPFNPMTTLKYQIPEESHVTLRIYNVLGQEIRTLVDESIEAGEYIVIWDGRDSFGHEVASGIFFSRMEAGRFLKTRKMIILK